MMKRHRLLQAALAVLIVAGAYGLFRYMVRTKPVAEINEEKRNLIHVKADTVTLRDYDVSYSCFAKVYAGATVKLSSEVSARIVPGEVTLREGVASARGICSCGSTTRMPGCR